MAGFYNEILHCANVDFRQTGQPTAQVTTDGDILLGATAAPNIRKGTLTSTGGSITITYVPGTNPSLNFETTGGQAVTSFNVDANTAPGTDPVVPTVAGQITVTGGQTAPGTIANVIRTNSLAANAWTTQIQQTSTAAAKNTALNGVSHFNSAQFSNDEGFISVTPGGLFPWLDRGGAFAASAFTGYFIEAAATATLPASPSQGDTIKFVVDTTGVLVITANTGQKIRIANQITSTAGTFTSSLQGDAVNLVYRTSGATWIAENSPCGIWIPS